MRSARLLAAVSFLSWSSAVGAADSTFGTTNAQACYDIATFDPSGGDVRTCTRAIKNDYLTRTDRAATLSNRGIIWSARGLFDRALADHTASIDLDTRSARAHVNRGNVHYKTRHFTDAIADYDRAAELSGGKLAVVFYNRALAYKESGNGDAARADIDRALALAPGNEQYLNARSLLD